MTREPIQRTAEQAERDLHRGEDEDDETRLLILEGLYRELEGALDADGEAGPAGH
jgi:hypothetical protein